MYDLLKRVVEAFPSTGISCQELVHFANSPMWVGIVWHTPVHIYQFTKVAVYLISKSTSHSGATSVVTVD